MKKIFAILALILTITANASAVTLIYPDINYDSRMGAGNNTFGSQGIAYDPVSGWLTVSARALGFNDGTTYTPLVNGTVDYRADFTGSAVTGGLVTGNFGTDGVLGNDLIITDTTGTLLTGNFISYQIDGNIGTNRGSGEAIFTITGGSLATDFGSYGGILSLYFNITPKFSATTFEKRLNGSIKGDIGAIPEPGTIILLGSGLLGILLIGRKREQ